MHIKCEKLQFCECPLGAGCSSTRDHIHTKLKRSNVFSLAQKKFRFKKLLSPLANIRIYNSLLCSFKAHIRKCLVWLTSEDPVANCKEAKVPFLLHPNTNRARLSSTFPIIHSVLNNRFKHPHYNSRSCRFTPAGFPGTTWHWLWTGHQHITGLTFRDKQPFGHNYTYGQFRVTSYPNQTTFGLWEEARNPETI